MKKTEVRKIAKDVIQEALSKAYYSISDAPEEYGCTEEESLVVIEELDKICEQICKRMGRTHYTV